MNRTKELQLAVDARRLASMVDFSITKLDLSRCGYVDDEYIEYIAGLPQFARICIVDLRGTSVTKKALKYILMGEFGTRRVLPYISNKYDGRYEASVVVIVDEHAYDPAYNGYAIPVANIVGVDYSGRPLNIDYSYGAKYLHVTTQSY